MAEYDLTDEAAEDIREIVRYTFQTWGRGQVASRLLKNPLRAQAFRLVRNRGALLKAGVRPSKKGNDECGPA